MTIALDLASRPARVPGPRGLPDRLGARSRERALVMGVLNVTPDSFSDGGLWETPRAAVAHGHALVRAGADLVDVGGESTRPGALRVPPEVEVARVLPVVRELAAAGVAVSIDTMRASTARQALDAGAVLVNDVSGGLADPEMAHVVAAAGCPYIAMHWRAHSDVMSLAAHYDDVVADVRAELSGRLAALVEAGVDPAQVVLDPGLGFAKHAEHDWALIAGLDQLAGLGRPLLVGASRKRFLGSLLAGAARPDGPAGRDAATAAVSALVAAGGVWCVRVHDVASSLAAVLVAAAVAGTVDRSPAPAGRAGPP